MLFPSLEAIYAPSGLKTKPLTQDFPGDSMERSSPFVRFQILMTPSESPLTMYFPFGLKARDTMPVVPASMTPSWTTKAALSMLMGTRTVPS
jgi:hypothetical protein